MRRPLLAVLSALALLAPVASAQARAQESGGGRVSLVSQTPWVHPGEPTELRLHLDLDGPGGDLEIAVVTYQRITSRSGFQLTLRDQGLGPVIGVRTAPVESLARDANGNATVRIDTQDPSRGRDPAAITLPRQGVYPLRVELRSRGEVLDAFTTHLISVPRDLKAPPLGVVMVVPVRAPIGLGPDLRRHVEGLDSIRDVLQVLDKTPGTPLVISPSPELLDTLRARAAASPQDQDGQLAQSALATLRRVVAGRQVVAGPYVPVDLPALLDAGLEGEADAQVQQGRAIVDDVVGLGGSSHNAWLADEVDNATLAMLASPGRDVSQIVVPERALSPVRLQTTLARPFLLGSGGTEMLAAAADDGLASHFSNDGDPALLAHHLLADLSVLFFDEPASRRAVVAAPPRSWRPSAAFVDEVLTGLTGAPILQPATIDTLFGLDQPLATDQRPGPLTRTLAAGTHAPAWLQELAPRIRNTRLRLSAFDLLGIAGPLRGTLSERLLISESADLRTTARRREYLDALDDDIKAQLRKVKLPAPRTITFTARNGEIPLTVLNTTGLPVQTVLRLRSDKLEFRATRNCRLERNGRGQTCRFPLGPGNTTGRFPVLTRTSGAFPATITLSSPPTVDGRLYVARTTFTVRSTAPSGVGVALSVGAGLFLVIWWGRHVVRGRRARRLVPA